MLPFGNSERDFPGDPPVEGRLLADVLSAGWLNSERAFRYAVEIGAAIDDAHSRGLVHGSLSPFSIAITPEGARVLRPQHPDPRAAAYRAPEQVRGEVPDARSDIFAYGAILYELASGDRAFPEEGEALDQALLNKAPPPFPQTSPLREAMAEVIESCLEKEILARRQRIRNAVVELKLRSGAFRRAAKQAHFFDFPRAAVIEFPHAAPPPPASLPIHAVATPQSAAFIPPRLDHFQLIPDATALAYPHEPVGRPPDNPPASLLATGYDWRIWAAASMLALLVAAGALRYFRHSPEGTVRRFTVAPPEGSSFIATPAVSPDGRYVVFSGLGTGGNRMLWLRPLDAPVSSPLSGTDGGAHPFWSPDSQSIAFFAEKSLKRISLHSREAQMICPADLDPGGGTWNQQGDILFAPNTRDGLYLVRADGGKPHRLIGLNQQTPEVSFRWPQFLPDGSHFLFFVLTNAQSSTGVYAGSLTSQEHFLALPSETNAVYSSLAGDSSRRYGHLLYLRGSTLFRQQFDSQKLRLTGEPSVVAINIGAVQSLSLAPVSVSNNATLAYQPLGTPTRQLVWLDRSGLPLHRVDPPGDWGQPRLAPDSVRAVADKLNDDGNRAGLWIIHRDGRAEHLPSSQGNQTSPVWSPDGSRIVFLQRAPDTPATDLAVMSTSGTGKPEVLLRNSLLKFPTDWSADGRFLFFHARLSGETSKTDLWAFDFQARHLSTPIVTTTHSEGYGALSPESHWLAYQSDETGQNEIYVQGFPAISPDTQRRWRISKDGGSLPRWRGDGKELYYLTAAGRFMAAAVRSVGGEFLSETPQFLFQTPVIPKSWNQYDVSRDGQRFLFNLPQEWPPAASFHIVTNWTELY